MKHEDVFFTTVKLFKNSNSIMQLSVEDASDSLKSRPLPHYCDDILMTRQHCLAWREWCRMSFGKTSLTPLKTNFSSSSSFAIKFAWNLWAVKQSSNGDGIRNENLIEIHRREGRKIQIPNSPHSFFMTHEWTRQLSLCRPNGCAASAVEKR